MEKLIMVLIAIGIFWTSCTLVYDADTSVVCPCSVVGVKHDPNSTYYTITIKSSEEENECRLSFSTTTPYEIGDTIQ